MSVLRSVSRGLGSVGLSCVLVLLLALLTWLGTLAQVEHGLYEVQRRYFESWFLVERVGPVPLPLPGGQLVMGLLFLNLLVGGLVRVWGRKGTAGILLVHLGIVGLLAAGLVKLTMSEDGQVSLLEGGRANHFQNPYRWELAVRRDLGDGTHREWVVPQEDFLAADGAEAVTVGALELPFTLEVSHVQRHCTKLPKGPMFEVDVPVVDGWFLSGEERLVETAQEVAGAYVTVVVAEDSVRRPLVLWGRDSLPAQVRAAGADWTVSLRKERYPMPFTIVLDDFHKEEHPRSGIPRSFSSDVTVIEDGVPRPVRIEMNAPLRAGGLVVYQAGWGPQNAAPGTALFSTLAVVRNPADQWPLVSCLVIAAGLLLHFGRKLGRWVGREAGGARGATPGAAPDVDGLAGGAA